MKKIYESVTFGIIAVNELGDLIQDERNEEKREILKSTRYAYYYLIDNMNKQFGVTRRDVLTILAENGYGVHDAMHILNAYEDWAQHVIKLNECGDGT
jgi:hypothetical protein